MGPGGPKKKKKSQNRTTIMKREFAFKISNNLLKVQKNINEILLR